jgi:L-lactate utilization protein LutC
MMVGYNIVVNLSKRSKMELTISDEKTKELLTEVMVELIKTRKDIFYEIILEALEEVGLANAILEGRENNFVSEEKIFSIIDGDAQ